MGKPEESVSSYNKAIQLQPDAGFYSNRGNVLQNLGKIDEAISSHRRAIQLKPDYAHAYSNLLLSLQYKIDLTHDQYLPIAQEFGRNCSPDDKTIPCNYIYTIKPTKLRIGFVSSDFGNHPGGYFSFSTLKELKNKKLELIAYSNFDRKDQLAHQFRYLFTEWRSIENLTDKEVATLVIKDGIHILVDLQGHTSRNRLPVFAYKPAPIQVSWLSPVTTGIQEIDYFIGSPYLIPKIEENQFVEKVIRLPETEACFTPPNFEIPVNGLPAHNNNFITFGCFNILTKMNDSVVALWSQILSELTNSKLYLKAKLFHNQKVISHTLERFQQHDIEPDRLILQGWAPNRQKSLLAYHQVDIALDPFPFQGHTTTCEAIWMGVPVVTLKGNRFLFHAGENVNYNIGMEDWVADDQEQYISKAIDFGSDLDQLSKIRQNLRQQVLKSPIFDAPRLADHFNQMLWRIWSESSLDNK